jgi:hypothetical protein
MVRKVHESPDWLPDLSFATGKGATVERFKTRIGKDALEIDTRPWGEGELRVNGAPIAHVCNEASERDAFRDLEEIAEAFEAKRNADSAKT